jgi:hypothetical protein
MEDFKDKIMGAMNSTNKVVKDTLGPGSKNRASMVVEPLSAEQVLPDDLYDDHEPFSE